jgi:hypothetical protein
MCGGEHWNRKARWHQAVHAIFRLKVTVGYCLRFQCYTFYSAVSPSSMSSEIDFEFAAFGQRSVHPHQHLGPILGFCARRRSGSTKNAVRWSSGPLRVAQFEVRGFKDSALPLRHRFLLPIRSRFRFLARASKAASSTAAEDSSKTTTHSLTFDISALCAGRFASSRNPHRVFAARVRTKRLRRASISKKPPVFEDSLAKFAIFFLFVVIHCIVHILLHF